MKTATLALVASVVASAPTAADIVYTDPPDMTVRGAGPWEGSVDVDGDGVPEFVLHFESLGCTDCTEAWAVWMMSALGRTDSRLCKHEAGDLEYFLVGFPAGVPIDDEALMAHDGELAKFVWGASWGGTWFAPYGDWGDADCGRRVLFAGLEFDIGGEPHFGWARVGVDCGQESATVYDFAYESDAGVPITAGDTGYCPADCTADDAFDIHDFVCMQAKWKSRDPYGDYDRSGTYTINDFIAFQADFRRGCP